MLLLQTATSSQQTILPWYQVYAGILAVPAAIISLPYAWVLLRKARLESKKIELEILEKTAQLGGDAAIASRLRLPETLPANLYLIGSLLLRYILYMLVLEISQILQAPLSWLMFAINSGLMLNNAANAKQFPMFTLSYFVGMFASGLFGSIVYWTIFFAFGLPLFKDILAFFGIRIGRITPKGLWHSFFHLRRYARNIRRSVSDTVAHPDPPPSDKPIADI